MRISFEWEWENPIPKIKQTYKELVCKGKGHLYEKYVEPKVDDIERVSRFLFNEAFFLGRGKPIKVCKRCGNTLYKKVEPKIVKFIRYYPFEKI